MPAALPGLGAQVGLGTLAGLGALQIHFVSLGLLCQAPDNQVWCHTENSRNDKESRAAHKNISERRDARIAVHELAV